MILAAGKRVPGPGQTAQCRHRSGHVTLTDTPIWLRALLSVAGLAAGMAAHLAFHPQRRQFSEAFDLLKNRPHLLLIGGVLLLAQRLAGSDGFHALPDPQARDWGDWFALAWPLAAESLTGFATLLHQALPPWPAALLLPAGLTVALFHLARQPYRAGLRQRPRGGELGALAGLTIVLATAFAIEGVVPAAELSEWQLNLLLLARLLAVALLSAGMQIWLLRVILRWLMPPPRRGARPAGNAWWEMLGRWPLVLALAGFNLLWITLRYWLAASDSRLLPWLLIEWLLFFSGLPVAVALAAPGSSFLQAGAEGLRLLWRGLAALLGLALTSVVILALAGYADGVVAALCPDIPLLHWLVAAVSAFALAFIHIWLFLAAALSLLRSHLPALSDPPPP